MAGMLLAEIAATSADVASTSSRLAKVARLTECLLGASADEVAVAVSYLSGELPQGTVGVGWAAVKERPEPAAEPSLDVLEVDATMTRLQGISGAGSQAARREALQELFSRATEPEQRLLVGLFLGELRQGALEGVMADAVAKAAGVPIADVRRAVHARRGSRGCGRGRDPRRERRARTLPPRAAPADRPDARPDRERRRCRARAPRRHVRRMEARRRAHPGSPCGRPGRRLHAQPRRHHDARARDRGSAANLRGDVDRPRRRGDRIAGPTAAPRRFRSR